MDRHRLIDGVSVNYVSQMHIKKTGNTKIYFPVPKLLWITFVSIIQLSFAALSEPMDIVLIGKPHPMNSIAGFMTRIFRKCSLVLDVDDDEEASGYFQVDWQRRVLSWFANAAPRYADWVITNTHHSQRKLVYSGVNPNNIYYLPNGVDPARFLPPLPDEVNELRNQYSINNKKVVLYSGSLSLKSHAVDLLIDAVHIVTQERNDIVLLLVGGGEDISFLQEKVIRMGLVDVVIFCGRINPMAVRNYYALADLSIDPVKDDDASRGRNPLKMFESWICDVPFLTADVGDRRLLAGNPPAALLVNPGDPEAMASAIQRIIGSPVLTKNLRNAGQNRVEQFTWDTLTQQLNEEILGRFSRYQMRH